MSTIAERLAAARAGLGMTQADLARAAKLKNQSIIGMLESGERKSSSYIPQIAAALGVSALWLATEEGPKDPSAAEAASAYANEPRLNAEEQRIIDGYRAAGPEAKAAFAAIASSVLSNQHRLVKGLNRKLTMPGNQQPVRMKARK